jgi:hypothetical protein
MKSVVKIRFNFLQRLRVLLGQKVYVVSQVASLPPYECWVSPNDYMGNEKLESDWCDSDGTF